MMSQRSSNKIAYFKDFLRSLAEAAIFPAVALAVIFFATVVPVLSYVSSDEFKSVTEHNEISMFFDSSMGLESLMCIGMVLCGMLTAVKLFSFSMSKKKVNVFFSLPISRSRLFANRAAAGLLCLFIAVFLPMTVTYIINAASFGVSTHLTQIYLYITALLFTSGFAGFSIGALASVVSGNIFEAALTSGSLAFLPQLVNLFFASVDDLLLKGHTYSYTADLRASLFSPFTFGIDYNAVPIEGSHSYFISPITLVGSLLSSSGEKDWKLPENMAVDAGFILPVFIWFAVSVALIVPAVYLFNRRRAENANSMGKFRVSTSIVASAVFFGAACVLFSLLHDMLYSFDGEAKFYNNNMFVFAALLILSLAVVYFLVQLILKRNLKAVGKSFILFGALIAVSAFMMIFSATERFGTYNKLPELSEIKSVSVDIGINGMISNSADSGNDIVYSENADDIKTVTEVFGMLRDEEKQGESLQYVSVVLKTKDDKTINRSFPIYSEDTYKKYIRTVYNSNFYDLVLERALMKEPEINADDFMDPNVIYDSAYIGNSLRTAPWSFFDSDILLKSDDKIPALISVPDTAALCEALYKDLKALDYDTVYKNPKRPLAAVSTDYNKATDAEDKVSFLEGFRAPQVNEYDENGNPVFTGGGAVAAGNAIFVYPEMTNTVKYLEDCELLKKDTFDSKIKEVLYSDSKLNMMQAVYPKLTAEAKRYNWNGNGIYFNTRSDIAMDIYDISGAMDENFSGTEYEFLKAAYTAGEHPLISVTDANRTQAIFNACVPQYETLGDNGRYAYVIYDDGTMMEYYLPEVNIGVLK